MRLPPTSTLFPYNDALPISRVKGLGTWVSRASFGFGLTLIAFAYSRWFTVSGLILIGVGFTIDRKSTRLNSSHVEISYAVFCLYKRKLIFDVGLLSDLSLTA